MKKAVLACSMGILAVAGFWWMMGAATEVTALSPASPALESPLDLPAVPLSPTLTLVGSAGELLSTPPACRFVLSDRQWSCTLRVHNPTTSPVTVVARLEGPTGAGQPVVPAVLGLSPAGRVVDGGGVGAFSLSLAGGEMPEGTMTVTLHFSADGVEPLTLPLVLVASRWPVELEWAQEDFTYEIGPGHGWAAVRVVARYGDAEGVRAELAALRPKGEVTGSLDTSTFLTITPPPTLTEGVVAELLLEFDADRLLAPGTYEGALRLSAANAGAISTPFTLIVPDQPRGVYQIAYGELGGSPALTPSLPLTTALQLSGVRWLPGSAAAGKVWPVVAGALLAFVAVVVLVGYTVWALAVPGARGDGRWLGRNWPWIAAVAAGGVAGALVVLLAGGSGAGLGRVGERTLQIWEVQGRGPVRDVAVLPGQMAGPMGAGGELRLNGSDQPVRFEIGRGEAVEVSVGAVGLTRPGAYRGYLLIQSPDIAAGVVTVPVQATVHDFILWPVLVILLGVVLGGWVKYQQELAGKRPEKRREIEKAWQQWDDYLPRDPYGYSQQGSVNPIYSRVRFDLDYVLRLLEEEIEWGIEEVTDAVKEVGTRLTTYEQLGRALVRIREEKGDKAFEGAHRALSQGDLEGAVGQVQSALRRLIASLQDEVKVALSQPADDQKKQLLEALKALLQEAEQLLDNGKFEEAWIKADGVRGRLQQEFPQVKGRLVSLFVEREVELPARPEYEIEVPFGSVRYRVRESIPLRIVRRGGPPPQGTDVAWEGPILRVGEDPLTATAEFQKEGRWEVRAVVKPPQGEPVEVSREFLIGPSGLQAVYRDKRRHNFNRRLAAGLVALIGGMVARQVFGLTFGSFEEYLGAFGWGIGVSTGVDPVAAAYDDLKAWAKKLLSLEAK